MSNLNTKINRFKLQMFAILNRKYRIRTKSCSLSTIKSSQLIEFGSSITMVKSIQLNSLPMNEESVSIPLSHSLFQYGSLTVNQNDLNHFWCPQSHQQLFDDHFNSMEIYKEM